jgi:hypothetical protein
MRREDAIRAILAGTALTATSQVLTGVENQKDCPRPFGW